MTEKQIEQFMADQINEIKKYTSSSKDKDCAVMVWIEKYASTYRENWIKTNIKMAN